MFFVVFICESNMSQARLYHGAIVSQIIFVCCVLLNVEVPYDREHDVDEEGRGVSKG